MNMISEVEQMKYVVKVGSAFVSQPLPSRFLAEQELSKLPAEQQSQATIVTVTLDGKEILLG